MIDPTQTRTLDEIAAWLLAAYGGRLVELRLTLLAHPDRRLLGVVPHAVRGWSGRRERPFKLPARETWQTLPSSDTRHAAEATYRKIVLGCRFHPGPIDEAERLGVGRLVRAADLDPALAAALLERFGPLPRFPEAPAKQDAPFDEGAYSPVYDALRDVAEWLIALYGTRLDLDPPDRRRLLLVDGLLGDRSQRRPARAGRNRGTR